MLFPLPLSPRMAMFSPADQVKDSSWRTWNVLCVSSIYVLDSRSTTKPSMSTRLLSGSLRHEQMPVSMLAADGQTTSRYSVVQS